MIATNLSWCLKVKNWIFSLQYYVVFKKPSLPTNALYQNLIVMFLTKVFELS